MAVFPYFHLPPLPLLPPLFLFEMVDLESCQWKVPSVWWLITVTIMAGKSLYSSGKWLMGLTVQDAEGAVQTLGHKPPGMAQGCGKCAIRSICSALGVGWTGARTCAGPWKLHPASTIPKVHEEAPAGFSQHGELGSVGEDGKGRMGWGEPGKSRPMGRLAQGRGGARIQHIDWILIPFGAAWPHAGLLGFVRGCSLW